MPMMSVHFKALKIFPKILALFIFFRILRFSLLTSMFSLNKTFSSSSAIEKLWISSRLYFADIKFALLLKLGLASIAFSNCSMDLVLYPACK